MNIEAEERKIVRFEDEKRIEKDVENANANVDKARRANVAATTQHSTHECRRQKDGQRPHKYAKIAGGIAANRFFAA